MKKLICAVSILLLIMSLGACGFGPRPLPRPKEPDSGDNITFECDEIWPMPLRDYINGTPYYSPYLTFRIGDKWGIIDEEFNVIVEAFDEYPGGICIEKEIHIGSWPGEYVTQEIPLKPGYSIADGGHGGGGISYVCDVDSNEVLIWSYSEGSSEVMTIDEFVSEDYFNDFIDIMPSIVPMRYIKQSESEWEWPQTVAYGYCDKQGNILSTERYDYADYFSSGVATVMKNGKWAYIDESMRAVTGFEYSGCYGIFYAEDGMDITPGWAHAAVKGLIAVRDASGKYGIIDTSGQTVLPFEHDSIVPLDNGNFFIQNDDIWEIKSI